MVTALVILAREKVCAVGARDLPVYRWRLERVTDDDEDGEPERGRPRSLASGSGRPIGRRPAP